MHHKTDKHALKKTKKTKKKKKKKKKIKLHPQNEEKYSTSVCQNDQSTSLTKVRLNGPTMFNQQPFFHVAYQKKTPHVRQPIFVVPHGSAFIYGTTVSRGVGPEALPPVTGEVEEKALAKPLKSNKERGWPGCKKGLQVQKEIGGRKTHKERGYPGIVKANQVQKEQGYPNVAKGRESQTKNGFPGLVKGRQAMKDAGYPNLVKARQRKGWPHLMRQAQIQKENGHPALQKARRINKEGGYPQLLKVSQRSKELGYPGLEKGHQTQKEQGWPGLAKGRQTAEDNGWQALARGRETQKSTHMTIREARLRTLWESFEVQELIAILPESFTYEMVKEMYVRYATYHDWPVAPWEGLSREKRWPYKDRLQSISREFRDYQALLTKFQEMTTRKQSLFLNRWVVWYDDKDPSGLRNPHPAIFMFHPGNFRSRTEFKALLNRNQPTADSSALEDRDEAEAEA
ncbi:hypothetical protein CCMA1212_003878 [Trichoderma ghanense]|uniref:Uncharacterized protein n=1 Tax=Trichoderma ghanense TaxID=65468 RepID=A0ABY2H6R1_9HYPO